MILLKLLTKLLIFTNFTLFRGKVHKIEDLCKYCIIINLNIKNIIIRVLLFINENYSDFSLKCMKYRNPAKTPEDFRVKRRKIVKFKYFSLFI